ncbi:hypothetical protein QSV34_15060 [Porticoccus sp. W117]|uniref:hypothetical protein n=1 Tax=Porticoccus sp. W117 TaxID=3054777 RepID=UPI002594CA93|nr:hypothetical protein [Porticoccus sp. W117]MDM3872670.1 hypothetical protein [Porticoccus sp. W117]
MKKTTLALFFLITFILGLTAGSMYSANELTDYYDEQIAIAQIGIISDIHSYHQELKGSGDSAMIKAVCREVFRLGEQINKLEKTPVTLDVKRYSNRVMARYKDICDSSVGELSDAST